MEKKLIKKNYDDQFDEIYENLVGIGDNNVIVEESDYKSIGCSETLLNNINDYDGIKVKLNELCTEVHTRITIQNHLYRTITLTVRKPNFVTTNKSFTYKVFQKTFDSVFLKALELWETHFMNSTVRLLGVSLSNLKTIDDFTKCMLFDSHEKNQYEIEQVINKINAEFNQQILKKLK